jgi:ketosteroid isomerase-like protein
VSGGVQNVDAVRRALDALARRDSANLEEIFAEDGEWRPLLTAGGELERPVYRGPQAMANYFADLDDLFEDTVIHIDSLDAVGSHRVMFCGRVTARGRGSGVPVDEHIWAVYEVHDGKLTRGTAHRSQAEALEAVGLTE